MIATMPQPTTRRLATSVVPPRARTSPASRTSPATTSVRSTRRHGRRGAGSARSASVSAGAGMLLRAPRRVEDDEQRREHSDLAVGGAVLQADGERNEDRQVDEVVGRDVELLPERRLAKGEARDLAVAAVDDRRQEEEQRAKDAGGVRAAREQGGARE